VSLVNKITYPHSLPVCRRREDILAAMACHQVVIVAGETGSGKTTQLPKMCLEAGLAPGMMIACTQPRRIAATSVSRRVAEELGAEGHLVGYKIRFADRTTRDTRIKFLTDGMLLAEAASDRRLSRYQYIIIDEAHERGLNIDFLLGIVKRLAAKRPDLKIIISSATLDTAKFAAHFSGAAVIEVEGKTFPVEVRYRPPDDGDEPLPEMVGRAVSEIVEESSWGDILVFLPTERDIMDTVEHIEALAAAGGRRWRCLVLPLFGRLGSRDQGRIFAPAAKRKIVVATNVAETSVTVPGVRYVVDSGLARVSYYNPRARTTKLPVTRISRASADQRKGRCGRTGPGICVRLYAEEDYLGRPAFTPPEIQRANLAEVILRMADLRLGDPARFPFIDPPHPRAVKDGFQLLAELGALTRRPGRDGGAGRLTKRGKLMARLPLDPSVSRMIIEAGRRGVMHEVMIIAACLSIQDPRRRPVGREREADERHRELADPSSDFLTLLRLFDHYRDRAGRLSRSKLRKYCRGRFLSWQRMREWVDLYHQLCSIMRAAGGLPARRRQLDPDAVHQSILSGILRHVALKKEKNLYTGAHGKELMIFPGSVQFGAAGRWIMAAELLETSRLFARTVATINVKWIERLAGPLCRRSYSEPHWHKKRGCVAAYETVTLFGLVLESRRLVNYAPIDPVESRRIFIQAALVEGGLARPPRFLLKNLALVRRLEEYEERSRRRDLVDESRVFAFYESRLPEDVLDAAALRRIGRKLERSLEMTESDIAARRPDESRLAQFPTEMEAGGFRLGLRYRFDPGSDEDGVSVLVPAAAVSAIDPGIFEWLVPGLLADKLTVLFKGLPKALRRQLVPVNTAAARVAADLEFGHGDFHQAVSASVRRLFGLRLDPVVLRRIELPRHLTMRYCLMADGKQPVLTSRSFSALLDHGGRAVPKAFVELRKKWRERDVRAEDLDALPAVVPVKGADGRAVGEAYPVLRPHGEGARLDLTVDRSECRRLNRSGLLHLYRAALAPQVRMVEKDCRLASRDWPLYEWIGERDAVNAALIEFILVEVLGIGGGELPAANKEAAGAVERWKTRLYPEARDLFVSVRGALEDRRRTADHIAALAAKGGGRLEAAAMMEHLAAVFPADFTQRFSRHDLRQVQRHLRALRIRAERAYASPGRDAEKAARLAPYLKKLASLRGREEEIDTPARRGEFVRLLGEFETAVNEMRISLFAPEVKTALPVSAKRLDRALAELESLL